MAAQITPEKPMRTLADLDKEFGKGEITILGQMTNIKVERISTGIPSLDLILDGGIPKGRITEMYGPESSGKTTLCMQIISECQKKTKGQNVGFLDVEQAFDETYAHTLNIDPNRLYFSRPGSGELTFKMIEKLLDLNLDLIVIDSVANMTPMSEINGEFGDATMGAMARMIGQGLRKITAKVSKKNTAIIFINQLRAKIGGYGNPETTTGGNSLKFYSSLRLDVRRKGKLEKGSGVTKEVIGQTIQVRIMKNKCGIAFKEAEFDLMYGQGISVFGNLLETAVNAGVIERAGAYYKFKDISIGMGREAAKKYLEENTEVLEEIEKMLGATRDVSEEKFIEADL